MGAKHSTGRKLTPPVQHAPPRTGPGPPRPASPVGATMDQTGVSGHLYHLQPTTGYAAFLKFVLLLTVDGICELYPLAHTEAHVLSRTLVRELRARTAGRPTPPLRLSPAISGAAGASC